MPLPSYLRRRPLLPLLVAGVLSLPCVLFLFLRFPSSHVDSPLDQVDVTLHLPPLSDWFPFYSSSKSEPSSWFSHPSPSSSEGWSIPSPHSSSCEPHTESDVWSRKYSLDTLLLSRGYSGSGSRFRRAVVDKALRGEGIKVGVIGGSVSASRNVLPSNSYHSLIFNWLNELFPHPNNTLVDGSVPATDSKYFSMCFLEHIPEDVDLVLVELSINDQRTIPFATTWETLVRAILELPNKPAVLAISTFALQYAQGIGGGGDVHLGVAEYYDIPVISLRNPVLPHFFSSPSLEDELFRSRRGLDRRHINTLGHEMLADFTTWWMREQLRISNPWIHVNDTQPTLHPSCKSTTSLPPLSPLSSSGFAWEEAPGEKYYWSASAPGATVSFGITVVEGRVGLFILRSRKKGLGSAKCWVDEDEARGVVAQGWWEKEESSAQFVAVSGDIPPGAHELTCQVLDSTKDPGGGHGFKIIGIATV